MTITDTLAVEPQQIARSWAETTDAGPRRYTAIRLLGIVHMGPFRQVEFALVRGLVGTGMGPFSQGGLNEPLGLAIFFLGL